MVRKGAPHERVRKGNIPSDDPAKDRARIVHTLFTIFKNRLDDDKRPQMIKKSEEILVIGDSDRLFDGKDPYVSGVAVFVSICRHFSYNGKCPVTYDEIRNELGNFASGNNFINMLKTLSTRFFHNSS